MKTLSIATYTLGKNQPLMLMAGPCVIEERSSCLDIAERLHDLALAHEIPLVFKASFDKANRTSVNSYRGPGMTKGLEILAEIKNRTGLPLLTDIHTPEQAGPVSEVVDILQIPAFLCRQTDLLVAAGETGNIINIKKGQFLAPEAMQHAAAKVASTGNEQIILTERGNSFGYGQLVADMRNLPMMQALGYPVVFDATHSVQRPSLGTGRVTEGDAWLAPYLARAAVATGCQGVFIETHLQPEKAKSDAANALPFDQLEALWKQLQAIHNIVK